MIPTTAAAGTQLEGLHLPGAWHGARSGAFDSALLQPSPHLQHRKLVRQGISPHAYLENTEVHTGLFWEIDTTAPGTGRSATRTAILPGFGRPNETYSHWFKDLKPGESFTTVPAAVGVTSIGFADAMGTLTDYRRKIRRKNQDNEKLPVIFNDYMNCLWGRPTAAEEYPLVDAAAEAGCEYFCIDAGWYADGDWWDSVGEWRRAANASRKASRKSPIISGAKD